MLSVLDGVLVAFGLLGVPGAFGEFEVLAVPGLLGVSGVSGVSGVLGAFEVVAVLGLPGLFGLLEVVPLAVGGGSVGTDGASDVAALEASVSAWGVLDWGSAASDFGPVEAGAAVFWATGCFAGLPAGVLGVLCAASVGDCFGMGVGVGACVGVGIGVAVGVGVGVGIGAVGVGVAVGMGVCEGADVGVADELLAGA